MRKAMVDLGGDPSKINPEVPVDLVIDHSVQVDEYGNPSALQANMDLEFERNAERYQFLNWAQKAFKNYRAVPPATGIRSEERRVGKECRCLWEREHE